MPEPGPSDSKPRREPVRVAPHAPDGGASPRGEVYQDGDQVIGAFFLPMHQPRDLKYHVGRRTITIWSRKAGHEFQTILVLPKWVNPQTFLLAHKNGLYEFVLDSAQTEPAPENGQ